MLVPVPRYKSKLIAHAFNLLVSRHFLNPLLAVRCSFLCRVIVLHNTTKLSRKQKVYPSQVSTVNYFLRG